MSGRLWLVGTGLVVAAGACGSSQARRPASEAPAVLEVQNDASLDVNIYVYAQGGNRDRLGTALAHRTSWFTIPQRLMFGLTPLRFQADPIGTGARPLSQEITVEPGDTVVLRIPPGGQTAGQAADPVAVGDSVRRRSTVTVTASARIMLGLPTFHSSRSRASDPAIRAVAPDLSNVNGTSTSRSTARIRSTNVPA